MTKNEGGATMSNYRVVQAWTLTKGSVEKRDGWDLLDGDNWCQRFWYKSDAMDAMRQLQHEESEGAQPLSRPKAI